MKNALKRTLAVMLAVIMTVCAAPLAGFVGLDLPELNIFSTKAKAVTSGTCGDNLTWTFEDDTGELVINGIGEMYNWEGWSEVPWSSVNSEIKSVTIGDGVTSICDYAFYSCTSLESVTFSKSLETIGDGAFDYCISLADIAIPNKVRYIGDNAFISCFKLENITIPDSVSIIGAWAFGSCDNLSSVVIGSGVLSIGFEAFGGCSNLTDITVSSKNTQYSSDINGVLFNKKKTELIHYPGGNERTSYSIPESVVNIADYAFYSCLNLKNIVIPNSVTYIGDSAFWNCKFLSNVKIPYSVTNIGLEAFAACVSLANITVDPANKYYSSDDYGVLFDKNKTTLIQYPDGNLRTNYVIPNSTVNIGSSAFSYCLNLTSVVIGNSVTSIGVCAFEFCRNLISVTIPDNVKNIGSSAFGDCDNLTNVIIGNGVSYIEIGAFGYCRNLTNITVDPENALYSSDVYGVLFNKDKTVLIQYPIGNKRSSYIIPSSTTRVEKFAFTYCVNLSSVAMGNKLASIGDTAFADCGNLSDVYYYGTVDEWNSIIVAGRNDSLLNAVIHFNPGAAYGFIYTQEHVAANYKTQNLKSAEKYFAGAAQAMDGSYYTSDFCIPGLSLGENMVPQGIAYYKAKNWLLISSYYKDAATDSCPCYIFALDFATGEMVAEYKIKTSEGTDFKAHVGGIGVSDYNLYITGNGADICRVSLSQLDEKTGEIIIEGTRSMSEWLGKANAAHLSINNGMLVTGNFFYSKDSKYDTPAKDAKSVIITQNLSGASADDEWKNFCNYVPFAVIEVPDSVDRIQGVVYRDEKFYISSSLGRKNMSSLIVADIDKTNGYTLKNITKHTALPMMEGMTFVGDDIYTVFESAASFYREGLDGKGKSSKPTDSVWKINYKKLIGIDESLPSAGDVENQYAEYSVDDKKGFTYLTFKQSWFAQDSAVYNHSLGKLCSQFAMIGYDDAVKDKNNETLHEYTKPNLKASLEAIGMTDIEIDGYTKEDEVNTLIAHRKINVNGEKYTLVFAGFIGSQDGQWYNNFDPGTGSVHKGFVGAKNHGYGLLQDYIQRHGFEKNNTKILLTGHSRGAATSNLVAAQLIKEQKYALKENIYTYAFATPNSTSLDERENVEYKRIFNIINPEDFVTKVIPAAWNFGRYGTTYVLPSKTNVNYYSSYLNNMQWYFDMFTKGETYEPYKDGELATYYVIDAMTSAIKNVKEFYSKKLKAGKDELTPFEFLQNTLCHFVSNIASVADMAKALAIIADTVLSKTSSKAYVTILDYFIVWSASSEDAKLSGCFNDAHRAETYCAYMMSMTETQIKQQRKGYLNTVNCPVDVEIYDKVTGELVGKIVNNVVDEEVSAKENSVVMSVEGDSKSFWLPSDGEYDVKLIGNGDGLMDYTVSVVDGAQAIQLERVNFFDVKIENGVSMEGEISSEDFVLEEYSLNHEDGDIIEPAEVIEGNELKNIAVNVTTEGNGNTTGSLVATSGDYITIAGVPDKDGIFIGWYEDGVLTSNDSKYSFVAKENRNLVARFVSFAIRNPSETKIYYGDSIILHADIDGELPKGYYIKWTADNDRFTIVETSADGRTCTVTPSESGDTVFTATVYDGDDNLVSSDEQVMTSKAGFFMKIFAFFKKLFGLTKTIPQVYKNIY